MICDIGFAVKLIRQSVGISQSEVASRINVPRIWISKIETRKLVPTPGSIYKLADALKVSPFTLMTIATAQER